MLFPSPDRLRNRPLCLCTTVSAFIENRHFYLEAPATNALLHPATTTGVRIMRTRSLWITVIGYIHVLFLPSLESPPSIILPSISVLIVLHPPFCTSRASTAPPPTRHLANRSPRMESSAKASFGGGTYFAEHLAIKSDFEPCFRS